jgi:hypothetical protein
MTTRTFRYVRHPDVEAYLSQGWEIADTFAGTHHGEWSVLMECPALLKRQTQNGRDEPGPYAGTSNDKAPAVGAGA